MAYYAHALIELADGSKIPRDSEVDPDLVEGFDELVEAGSISAEKYDPKTDVVPAPESVEIDGVKYVKVTDGAEESPDVRTQ